MGAKSTGVEYGNLSCRKGFDAKPVVTMSSVCPSGAAFATMSVPIIPPAPARLSTTMRCRHHVIKRGLVILARTSNPPPGVDGSTVLPDGGDNRGLARMMCSWRRRAASPEIRNGSRDVSANPARSAEKLAVEKPLADELNPHRQAFRPGKGRKSQRRDVHVVPDCVEDGIPGR